MHNNEIMEQHLPGHHNNPSGGKDSKNLARPYFPCPIEKSVFTSESFGRRGEFIRKTEPLAKSKDFKQGAII